MLITALMIFLRKLILRNRERTRKMKLNPCAVPLENKNSKYYFN